MQKSKIQLNVTEKPQEKQDQQLQQKKQNTNIFDSIQKWIGGITTELGCFFIHTQGLRSNYSKSIKASSTNYHSQFNTTESFSSRQNIVQQAVDSRNSIIHQTRDSSTHFSLTFAKYIKEEPKSLHELQNKYALSYNQSLINETSKSPFENLDSDAQTQIYEQIIKKSGTSNQMVNKTSEVLSTVGYVLIVLNVVLALLSIFRAENKLRQCFICIFHTVCSGLFNFIVKEMVGYMFSMFLSYGVLLVLHIVIGILVQIGYGKLMNWYYENKIFEENQNKPLLQKQKTN